MGGRYSIQTLLLGLLILISIKREQNSGQFLHLQSEIQLDCSNFIGYSGSAVYSNPCESCLYSSFVQPQASSGSSHKSTGGYHKAVRPNQYFFIVSLLMCGDIHPCPGPVPSCPCVICSKGVRSNSKAVSCDTCERWTRIKCAGITVNRYRNLVECDCEFDFICQECQFSSLPFHNSEESFGREEHPVDSDHCNSQENNVDNVEYYECFKKTCIAFCAS